MRVDQMTIRELMMDLGPNGGDDVADPHSLGGLRAAEFHIIREPWNISVGDATPIVRFFTDGAIPRRIYLAIEDGPEKRWLSRYMDNRCDRGLTVAQMGERPRPRWVLCEPV
jgi:hypothetical protein